MTTRKIETALDWFKVRIGKTKYSMPLRGTGNYMDCSSSVYAALNAAGIFHHLRWGSTDTLFSDLERHGWVKSSRKKAVRGDIFIWGVRGHSGWASGHTGMFVDHKRIIDCHYPTGITGAYNYDKAYSFEGHVPETIYHYKANDAGAYKIVAKHVFTKKERYAARIYTQLAADGWSDAAIAGTLGCLDGESGLMPTVKENGGRGPGYGIAQWTSPKATEKGSHYVKRLMKKAKINSTPGSLDGQVKLLVWGMTHGQWIGNVSPKKVSQFKKLKSYKRATYAFLRNFERAGVPRLSVRYRDAERWYRFIKKYKTNPGTAGSGIPSKEIKYYNIGELESVIFKDGMVICSGWHFATGMDQEYIEVYNATNDKLIRKIKAPAVKRPDLKRTHSNVPGIEEAGFKISFKLKAFTPFYLKGVRTDGTTNKEIYFQNIMTFEPAVNAKTNDFAKQNKRFFFEIYDKTKLVARGTDLLSTLTWTNELMTVPTLDITLPYDYYQYVQDRNEIKVYVNHKVFHGIVAKVDVAYDNDTIVVHLNHIISEWEFRQIGTNLAIKDQTINGLYSTLDFRYSNDWHLDYLNNSANRNVDYVYSRQTKLEGLTKTCELTDDLFWRVGFDFGRKLQIGSFGDKLPYAFSTQPASYDNIQILSDVTVENDYSNVVNALTVYGEKSNTGMNALSLRDVYNSRNSQEPGFPVHVLREGINNERGYDYITLSKIASNQELEYTIVDEKSLATEGYHVIEATAAFNDLSPFSVQNQDLLTEHQQEVAEKIDNNQRISDKDRNQAALTVYHAAIKRLKLQRRKWTVSFTVGELSSDINVGDKIRFLFDRNRLILGDCSQALKNQIRYNDYYYLTKIETTINEVGQETNVVTLSPTIQVVREQDNVE